MKFLYEAVEAVATFVEVYTLYRSYWYILYCHRRTKNHFLELICALLGVVMIRLGNQFSSFSYFLVLFFVLYSSISGKLLYKTNFMTLISIASFYSLCLGIFDFFILSFLATFFGGMEILTELVSTPGLSRIAMIIGVKIFWITIFLMLKKYLQRFSKIREREKQAFIISVLGFFGFIFLVEQTFTAFTYKIVGVWFLVLVICILLILVFYSFVIMKEEKAKSEFIEVRNQILENNYKSISSLYESNAKLYHDLNNHLNVLYQLLLEENNIDARKYINEISKPIAALEKMFWTGDDVVDAVLNSKICIMKEKGILFEINAEFPSNTGILSNDMCTILANILDNAIEATEKVNGEKKISLTMRRINHFLVIKVTNPCVKLSYKLGENLLTTKENKKIHGWGMSSVRSVVEKYSGTFEYKVEDNLFVVNIMLFFKE